MNEHVVGAAAGAAGALAWIAADRPLQAALGTNYSDVRVAGFVLRRLGLDRARLTPAIAHTALGAAAGAALEALWPRGSRLMLAAAELELLAAWPVMRRLTKAARERGEHIDDGARAFAEAAAGRAILGLVTAGVTRVAART